MSKDEMNIRAKERKEHSLEAMNYFNEHKVAQSMQTLVNQMFLDKPDDVNGYMARFFTSLALAPSIHHFEVDQTIDANCAPATKVSLFAKVKGECELIAESTVSDNFGKDESSEEALKNNLSPSKSSITAASKQPVEQSPESLDKSLLSINDNRISTDEMVQQINTTLQGKQLAKECLEVLSEAQLQLTPSIILAISQSIISGLSNSTNQPLYEVIAGFNSDGGNQTEFTTPLPMYHILSGTGGKSKLADFYISISPKIPIIDGLKYAQALYDKLRQSVKMTSPSMTDGAIRHSIDKLEQGFDLINESGKGLELSIGETVFVILNAEADKRWDCDKNKYEVSSGQWKSSAELLEYYNEIIRTHPGIILGVINAFHEQDLSGYLAFNKTHSCIILFVNTIRIIKSVGEKLKVENAAEEIGNLNSFVLSKHIEVPLNEWISCAKCRDNDDMKRLGFAIKHQPSTEVLSSFYVDLITGMNGSFLQVGGPRDKGTSLFITRLLAIEQELRKKNRLNTSSFMVEVFTSISK